VVGRKFLKYVILVFAAILVVQIPTIDSSYALRKADNSTIDAQGSPKPTSETLSSSTQIVETNFLNLKMRSFQLPSYGSSTYVAVDKETLFVLNRSDKYLSIFHVDSESLELTEKVPLPGYTTEEAQFNYPLELIFDRGNLYFAIGNGSEDTFNCGQIVIYRMRFGSGSRTFEKLTSTSPCVSGFTFWNVRLASNGKELFIATSNMFNDMDTGSSNKEKITIGAHSKNFKDLSIFGKIATYNLRTKKIQFMQAVFDHWVGFSSTSNAKYCGTPTMVLVVVTN